MRTEPTRSEDLHSQRAAEITAQQIALARDLAAETPWKDDPAFIGAVLVALATNFGTTRVIARSPR